MTEFVTVSIKLYLDVGNNDYIILRNFGGRIMSGFEFIEGSSGAPTLPPAPVAEKMLGIWMVKTGTIFGAFSGPHMTSHTQNYVKFVTFRSRLLQFPFIVLKNQGPFPRAPIINGPS